MQRTKFNKFLEKLEKVKLQNKILAIVLCIILIYISCFSIHYFEKYIEVKEINNGKYTEILTSEIKINVICFFVFFVISYIITYIQNKVSKICINKIAKKENVKLNKLPNKSICLLVSVIFAYIATNYISKEFNIFSNCVFSLDKDPIFNKSITYYILQRPFIEKAYILVESFLLFNILYVIGYYIAVFGYYFKGLEKDTITKSLYVKHILFTIMLFCIANILETTIFKDTILFTKLKLNNDSLFSSLMGSGFTDINIKLVYFRLLPYILAIGLLIAIYLIIEKKYKKLIMLPIIYVVLNMALFIVTGLVQNIYVKPNELTLEKKYIKYHLDYTKKAYDIGVDTKDIYIEQKISKDDLIKYKNVISNIDVINYDNILERLNENQEKFYKYSTLNTITKNENGNKTLYYISPKEIDSKELDKEEYINKYIKYTHGNETKIFKSDITDGKIEEVKLENEILNDKIYYGINTNLDCMVNSSVKLGKENIQNIEAEVEENYYGEYGISLRRLNRAVMAVKHLDYNFLLSNYIKKDTKFLINRNIIERTRKILPNMLIDKNPYLVIGENNKQYYVIDAYTVSTNYPYSRKINLNNKNLIKTNNFNLDLTKINYIRNSVKIVVDPYSGKLNIFNTDTEDIISRTYSNMYPNLFDRLEGNEVYESVKNTFKYPKALMDIQLEVLKEYFVEHPENFYKNENKINIPKFIDEKGQKKNLDSYYTFSKMIDKEEDYTLLQPVVNFQNKLTGYFNGYVENGRNKLDFYSITNPNTVISPMLLDTQILVEDTKFSAELEEVKEKNRLYKKTLVIPIDNKILTLQIYFTTPTELTKESRIYKVIVSDGQKIAVSKSIKEALTKIVNVENEDFISEEIIRNDLYSNIEDIIKTYEYVKNSMKQGDFEVYGREMQNLEKKINDLKINYENIKKNR